MIFRLLVGLVVALSVGFGTSYYALTDGRLFAAVRVGAWAAWPDIGQPTPDPYSRAYLARTGTLQLGYAEGLQFTAATDDSGDPLDARCQYRLTGKVPGASFWTLVATDPDGVNIAASPELPGLHSERVARWADGGLNATVGRAMGPGNWLEIEGNGMFRLVLTLYDAVVFSGANTTIEAMPSIEKVACQ
ncbi:hypothetical protein SAMN05428936_101568 [Pelagibacterium halotolerans]|uniref:DUF1214 domain-containing protein n=1 Tax=Pelagibacterium halotolerans (strain DSM 22347 / JCM 15775 / CGMCC 1.7692 / B2) TaxID=1082931 RepID=G4RCK4_PELHB|nr:hypothetical protein KKY_637 [Pelagibacterium halotolerans B2]SDZ92787.1 hypothetical protein SAMN05428936_101568 [Pelagibacterium halotolerans]